MRRSKRKCVRDRFPIQPFPITGTGPSNNTQPPVDKQIQTPLIYCNQPFSNPTQLSLDSSSLTPLLQCQRGSPSLIIEGSVTGPVCRSRVEKVKSSARNRPVKRCAVSKMTRVDLQDVISTWGGLDEHSVGGLTGSCVHCGALSFRSEGSNGGYKKCCNGGRIVLPSVPDLPPLLESLLTNNHPKSLSFRKNIRRYNNSLALASLSYKETKFSGSQIPCVVVNGEVKHFLSSRLDNGVKVFSELYVIDPEEANNIRLQTYSGRGLDGDLLAELDSMLRLCNPYVGAFKLMHEKIHELQRLNEPVRSIRMFFIPNRDDNVRQFGNVVLGRNCANTVYNEVAMVYCGNDNVPPTTRNICVYTRDSTIRKISTLAGVCDPLCYTMLYPKGEEGYRPKELGVTERRFYLHRLSVRSAFSSVLRSGKLTQQYTIDAFLRVEASRLTFIRNNQSQIRAETYSGLQDQLLNRSKEENVPLGKVVILPSTFEGGSRHFHEAYHDSMVLVRKYGKPDLFVTFTCNPSWADIRENIAGYETALDRPDIVSRVFNLKAKAFLDFIVSGKVFGRIVAYNYVIEFQKRGLPHMHVLFYLSDSCKIQTADDIDRYISAEIPDDTSLREIILTQNLHRCSVDRCLDENGLCVKKFPKQFSSATTILPSGFPNYRRKVTDGVVIGGGWRVDNSLVVPYNPLLSKVFNAHINVEYCCSLQTVKYLNMYMQKGGDIATVGTVDLTEISHDEVEQYQRMRYVGACEAFWRLSGFKMSGISHIIVRLAVHLPGQNRLHFQPGGRLTLLIGPGYLLLLSLVGLISTNATLLLANICTGRYPRTTSGTRRFQENGNQDWTKKVRR